MKIKVPQAIQSLHLLLISCVILSMLHAKVVSGQSVAKSFELFGPVELKFEPTLTFENLGKQTRIVYQSGSYEPYPNNHT